RAPQPPLLPHRLIIATLQHNWIPCRGVLKSEVGFFPPDVEELGIPGMTKSRYAARVRASAPPVGGQKSVAECDPDLGAIRPAAQTAGLDHDRGRPREEGRENILHLDLDLVAHPHELGTHVLRDPRINLQVLALVMNARPAGRVLRAVAVVQRIDDGLDDRAHDLPPAGRAALEDWTIRAQHEGRRARPEHALARRYR